MTNFLQVYFPCPTCNKSVRKNLDETYEKHLCFENMTPKKQRTVKVKAWAFKQSDWLRVFDNEERARACAIMAETEYFPITYTVPTLPTT